MHYFLNIGSNLGNRLLNISKAIRAIEAEFGYFELSKKVESAPWGFDSTNSFINVAMMVISDLEPEAVLDKLQAIELKLDGKPHRDREGGYIDRLIDIDIMAADQIEYHSERLTLPHPHLAERSFFLEPFSQLAPAWRHPQTGLTPTEMWEKIKTES